MFLFLQPVNERTKEMIKNLKLERLLPHIGEGVKQEFNLADVYFVSTNPTGQQERMSVLSYVDSIASVIESLDKRVSDLEILLRIKEAPKTEAKVETPVAPAPVKGKAKLKKV